MAHRRFFTRRDKKWQVTVKHWEQIFVPVFVFPLVFFCISILPFPSFLSVRSFFSSFFFFFFLLFAFSFILLFFVPFLLPEPTGNCNKCYELRVSLPTCAIKNIAIREFRSTCEWKACRNQRKKLLIKTVNWSLSITLSECLIIPCIIWKVKKDTKKGRRERIEYNEAEERQSRPITVLARRSWECDDWTRSR